MRRALVLAGLVALAPGCGGGGSGRPAATAGAAPSLPARLHGIAELRSDFAAHAAEPQLVLLISPT